MTFSSLVAPHATFPANEVEVSSVNKIFNSSCNCDRILNYRYDIPQKMLRKQEKARQGWWSGTKNYN